MAGKTNSFAGKKAEKAAYDREYRKRNLARIKLKKAAYFQETYDPVEAARKRKVRMPLHVEYCRQPRYKAWKKAYDKNRRDAKFGPFKDAHDLLLELVREIHKQQPDRFERYAQAQRHQWNPLNQQRRRRGNLNCKLDSF